MFLLFCVCPKLYILFQTEMMFSIKYGTVPWQHPTVFLAFSAARMPILSLSLLLCTKRLVSHWAGRWWMSCDWSTAGPPPPDQSPVRLWRQGHQICESSSHSVDLLKLLPRDGVRLGGFQKSSATLQQNTLQWGLTLHALPYKHTRPLDLSLFHAWLWFWMNFRSSVKLSAPLCTPLF